MKFRSFKTPLWIASLLQWRRDHRVASDAITSSSIGFVVLLLLLLFQPPTLSVVRRGADDTADKMIRLAQETGDELVASPGYTFIAIDDPTWAAWGYPLVTPRDKIADLVERAARSGPLAIILDVDLAYPGAPEGQAALRDVIERYDASAPPLLLVRSLIGAKTEGTALPLQRPTIYDEAAARHPNIVWASPLFLRDGDGKVRRWRLVTLTCAERLPAVLLSTHLIAASIVRATVRSPEPGVALAAVQDLRQRTAPLEPATCQGPSFTRGMVLTEEADGHGAIQADGTDAASRVLYAIGWTDDAVSLGPVVTTPHGQTPLVRLQSAQTVLSLPATQPIPGLAGRVVLIGGSYKASGDWHDTALGRMPGALLILNAVDALARNGTPQEPPLIERAVVSIGIILAVSLLTSFFRPFVAALLSGLAVFLVMLVSLSHFRSGIVLDLAVPAVAAALTDFVSSAIEHLRDLWSEGWGWIFKPALSAPGPTGEDGASRADRTVTGVAP